MATAPSSLTTTFDALKPSQQVTISFRSCMSQENCGGVAFKVGRRSHSKKYNVTSITLKPSNGSTGCAYKLYKRANGKVSMAHGDMGVVLDSIAVG